MDKNYYTVEEAKNKDCRQAFRLNSFDGFSFPSCNPEECMHWQWGNISKIYLLHQDTHHQYQYNFVVERNVL